MMMLCSAIKHGSNDDGLYAPVCHQATSWSPLKWESREKVRTAGKGKVNPEKLYWRILPQRLPCGTQQNIAVAFNGSFAESRYCMLLPRAIEPAARAFRKVLG
jgi:hypothetical protein